MSLSGIYGKTGDDEGIALIHEALDHGVTLLDSSDAYGAGHNEELVGKALKGRRYGVVLATKFGNLGGRDGKFADGRPEFVIESCETSLKRLGVDVIDLYYQHRIDPNVPIEDTVGAMGKLVQQGKVRALGISEASPADHPPRACDASARRGAERILADLSRRRRRDLGDDAQAQYRLCRLFAARPRPARPAASNSPRPMRGGGIRAFPATISTPISRWRSASGISRRRRTAPRASWCSRGCSRRATTSFRFPAPSRKRGFWKISARSMFISAPPSLKQMSDAIPIGAAAGLRYPEAQMKSVYI